MLGTVPPANQPPTDCSHSPVDLRYYFVDDKDSEDGSISNAPIETIFEATRMRSNIFQAHKNKLFCNARNRSFRLASHQPNSLSLSRYYQSCGECLKRFSADRMCLANIDELLLYNYWTRSMSHSLFAYIHFVSGQTI